MSSFVNKILELPNKVANLISRTTTLESYGQIAEKISNSNGTAIKFTDGTMICYKRVSGTITWSDIWGAIYYSAFANGNWAQQFKELYNVQATSTNHAYACMIGEYTNTSAGSTRVIRGTNHLMEYQIDIFAIGTWK